MGNNFKMLAKTLYGFEPVLAKELRNLGAIDVKAVGTPRVFCNRKGFHALNVQAIVDAEHRFTWLSVVSVVSSLGLRNKQGLNTTDHLSTSATTLVRDGQR